MKRGREKGEKIMMETKLVLLGTGTPNACPDASGPSSAVVVGDRAYLVDFGPGVVRQAAKAYRNGIDALRPDRLVTAFCTHLHTDHTAGYPDLIFTPWVLERKEPLRLFGPKGIRDMTEHLLKAYKVDIDFRINGFEKANEVGYRVETQEITSGVIYRDDRVTVEAFPVSHGTLESYGFKFTTPDRVIVISGDTAPLEIVAEKAKGCDILLHEVEYTAGLAAREPKWQKYHREVHTLSVDLAEIAKKARPKLLVTYHRIYHMEIQDNTVDVGAEMARRNEAILEEIRNAGYEGPVVNGMAGGCLASAGAYHWSRSAYQKSVRTGCIESGYQRKYPVPKCIFTDCAAVSTRNQNSYYQRENRWILYPYHAQNDGRIWRGSSV